MLSRLGFELNYVHVANDTYVQNRHGIHMVLRFQVKVKESKDLMWAETYRLTS